jgi:uncharacterized spore protein YtfJ
VVVRGGTQTLMLHADALVSDPDSRRAGAIRMQDIIGQARDLITVKRVFGEPYEKDGITVIPAARVMGGGGGGEGTGDQGKGGGFGVGAQPAGAYVIKDGDVRWVPAVDVNRIVMGGQIIVIVALLTIRMIFKMRARARVQEMKLAARQS